MVNDVISAGNVLVETDDSVLAFPAVLKQAGRLWTWPFPKIRSHSLHGGFVAGCEDHERSAGLEAHLGESQSKDSAHLLELMRDAAAVARTAIREDAEIWASHFRPWLFSGARRWDKNGREEDAEHTLPTKVCHGEFLSDQSSYDEAKTCIS